MRSITVAVGSTGNKSTGGSVTPSTVAAGGGGGGGALDVLTLLCMIMIAWAGFLSQRRVTN